MPVSPGLYGCDGIIGRYGRTRDAPQSDRSAGHPRRWPAALAVVCVLAVLTAAVLWWVALRPSGAAGPDTPPAASAPAEGQDGQASAHEDADKEPAPEPVDDSPRAKAQRAVEAMSIEERVGQLVMAPLYAGTDPSALYDLIANQHVGSVLIIGNWWSGTAGVRQATDVLQSYAPADNRLLMTTDQEGGLVQHLQGPGFDTMPTAVDQGAMSTDALRQSAAVWGSQLNQAGINVDLAPVVGTVTVDRGSNAPIGALYRDFGLDAQGNANHAIAFIEGMRDAGVRSAIKHYPGLGAVTGNTDFTADGIVDATTTLDGEEIAAFNAAIDADPGMVMMSLATYQQIDPNNPAAFSSTLIDGYLRGTVGYDGVITSDSLSAAALGGFDPREIGVRFVDAGADLACIGAADYVQPILDGLNERAASDQAFAEKVTRSAIRVMTLKYEMGLAQ